MTDSNASTPSRPQLATQTDDAIFEKVCALLAPYNQTSKDIERGTAIMADLEIDSVAVFDLIMEVEDEYDVTFPMETVSEMRTVGELVATIREMKTA